MIFSCNNLWHTPSVPERSSWAWLLEKLPNRAVSIAPPPLAELLFLSKFSIFSISTVLWSHCLTPAFPPHYIFHMQNVLSSAGTFCMFWDLLCSFSARSLIYSVLIIFWYFHVSASYIFWCLLATASIYTSAENQKVIHCTILKFKGRGRLHPALHWGPHPTECLKHGVKCAS